jgi:hypothetical protein
MRSGGEEVWTMTGRAQPPFDLSSAVFIDFETYGGGARGNRPVLVTVLDMRRLASGTARMSTKELRASDALRTFVLDHQFVRAASEKRLHLLAPSAFSRWLTSWQAHRRPILGFSMHDGEILRQWQPEATFDYVNVLPHARRWRARHHPDAVRRHMEQQLGRSPEERANGRRRFNSLVSFLRLAGVGVPRDHGAGSTTKRLKLVEEQLAERKEYRRLTGRAKASWVQVVRHNRFDVAGLRELAGVIAQDRRRRG